MSSTGRGAVRNANDFYATPPWCVDRLLEAVTLPGGDWIEPGAGSGNIIRAVNQKRDDVNWTAIELDENQRPVLETLCGPANVIIGPYLTHDFGSRRFAVAFGNPPFSLAFEFIKKSLDIADTVVMLERLNFLGSSIRHSFMQAIPPDVYVIPDRVSFLASGATDSIEYAWFVWNFQNLNRKQGLLQVLNRTPKQIRRGQNANNQ